MSKSTCLAAGLALFSLAFGSALVSAQKIEARVLYRQNSEGNYAALIPNQEGILPDGIVDCAADIANQACEGPSQPAAPGQPLLNVSGTTLSLLLPDGKVAVVNCVNKYSSRSDMIVRRSCAMPMVEHVEADFEGPRAKLKWLVGPDGRKTESETYKVVALLNQH
jgi:hypothetical protein